MLKWLSIIYLFRNWSTATYHLVPPLDLYQLDLIWPNEVIGGRNILWGWFPTEYTICWIILTFSWILTFLSWSMRVKNCLGMDLPFISAAHKINFRASVYFFLVMSQRIDSGTHLVTDFSYWHLWILNYDCLLQSKYSKQVIPVQD